MHRLVLLRHGQSQWNLENRFTGWTDVDLSPAGVIEVSRAAQLLQQSGFSFDMAFTSVLKRAIRTLWKVLDQVDLMWLPVVRSWRLNERHYGALQGLNKAETAAEFGEEQVHLWRRSYGTRPPALEPSDPRHPGRDRRYGGLSAEQLPLTESLSDTVDRFLPYWHQTIVPELRSGRRIIIVAHGNSIRALLKHLKNISDEAIVDLNIPTGIPLVCEFDSELKIKTDYYLGDPEDVERAKRAVAGPGNR